VSWLRPRGRRAGRVEGVAGSANLQVLRDPRQGAGEEAVMAQVTTTRQQVWRPCCIGDCVAFPGKLSLESNDKTDVF